MSPLLLAECNVQSPWVNFQMVSGGRWWSPMENSCKFSILQQEAAIGFHWSCLKTSKETEQAPLKTISMSSGWCLVPIPINMKRKP